MKKLLFTLLFFPLTSHASFLFGTTLEPYVNYHTSHEVKEFIKSGEQDGLGLGLRLGYSFLNFSVALDYNQVKFSNKLSNTENEKRTEKIISGLGVVSLLPFLRLWGGPILKISGDDFPNHKDLKTGSFGLKAGVGWSLAPLVNLTFEVLEKKYKSTDAQSSNKEGSARSFALGLSLTF